MIKDKLSRAARLVTPPIIWDAYLRVRNLGRERPWFIFRNMGTNVDTKPLFEGRFAEIHDRYCGLNPFVSDSYRYPHYNFCFFANLCRNIPGDFVCAGVAFGATAKIVYEFVEFPTLGKTLHLIDPFDATANFGKVSANYNSDPDYVVRQYPPGSPIVLHRQRIPLRLQGPLAYVLTDTGIPEAAAESLPIFYEALSPGGVIVSSEYHNNINRFDQVFSSLGVSPFWLPSGQCVIFKPY
jgi:hypothetical protein